MSVLEQRFCRSRLWQCLARQRAGPWALEGADLSGDVLELGGGGGGMAERVVRAFPEIRLTVTDVDPAMVAAANQRLGPHPNVCAVSADATGLPFADASFDAVLSFLMLHHVLAWEQTITEVARVLRPGGTLLGYDLLDRPLSRWVHVVDRSPHRLIRRAEFEPALRNAGLVPNSIRVDVAGHVIRFAAVK